MTDGYYYGFYSMEGFRGIMAQWAQFGVFDILLPLILVFAVVFAILEKINLFRNRGVHLVIAVVIGFFTVSNPYISGFFMYLFSNLGLGVAILLGLIVLLGVALQPNTKTWSWIFGIAGGLIFLVVLGRSGAFSMMFGSNFGYWIQANSALVFVFVIIAIMIIAVLVGVKGEQGAKAAV